MWSSAEHQYSIWQEETQDMSRSAAEERRGEQVFAPLLPGETTFPITPTARWSHMPEFWPMVCEQKWASLQDCT